MTHLVAGHVSDGQSEKRWKLWSNRSIDLTTSKMAGSFPRPFSRRSSRSEVIRAWVRGKRLYMGTETVRYDHLIFAFDIFCDGCDWNWPTLYTNLFTLFSSRILVSLTGVLSLRPRRVFSLFLVTRAHWFFPTLEKKNTREKTQNATFCAAVRLSTIRHAQGGFRFSFAFWLHAETAVVQDLCLVEGDTKIEICRGKWGSGRKNFTFFSVSWP